MSDENQQPVNDQIENTDKDKIENEPKEKKVDIVLILLLLPIIIPILIFGSLKLYNKKLEEKHIGGPISNEFKNSKVHDVYFSYMESDDIYHYKDGDNFDYIDDVGGTDTIKFGKGVKPQNIRFVKDSYGSLFIGVDSEHPGGITINKQFANDGHQIEKFEFEDGSVITDLTKYLIIGD